MPPSSSARRPTVQYRNRLKSMRPPHWLDRSGPSLAHMATRDELAAPSTSLEELADWRAVLELSTRYATGIDQRDWSLYRRCFTDQLRIDFSSFTHRPA